MAETLEIRLGGDSPGSRIATRDIDYSELHPLIEHLEGAALDEAGIDPATNRKGRTKNQQVPLSKVHLALDKAYTEETRGEVKAVYQFVVGRETAAAINMITRGLAGVGGHRLVPKAAKKVRSGIHRTIRRGLNVQLVNGVTTPVFSQSNPPPELAVHPTRKFESQLAVRLLRVGGKKPVTWVRLLGSRQEVTLDLPGENAARELGNHLYRDAVVSGEGVWVIDPDHFSAPTRLLSFKVKSYKLLRPTDAETVIDEMTKASGGIWDDVDPTNPEEVGNAPGGV